MRNNQVNKSKHKHFACGYHTAYYYCYSNSSEPLLLGMTKLSPSIYYKATTLFQET